MYRLAVDVGGTFTDVVVFDEETGDLSILKTPSTPENPAIGIVNGIIGSKIDMTAVSLFSHGSTVGTNALITRRTPRTALITTKGFRDIIEIRRGTREDIWDAYKDPAPPYVLRRDRFGVDERIDYSGKVLKKLDEEEAKKVVEVIKKRGIKSVAISFINSYTNDINEKRMKEIVREMHPEAFVCTSSEILPEMFEHERTSTTVINACLAPVVSEYLIDLTNKLREMGYQRDVLVMHSGGGVMTSEAIAFYAARIANSGPTAGAIAMSYIAKLCGYDNAMGLDMGGTSADISLMYNGAVRMRKEWWVEFGYPIMFPTVDLVTIGAGGGSVAWIDEAGNLKVGPQSMGADPGPACYMRGGEEPTITDANLVLERLSPETFAGDITINRDYAVKAIEKKIASKLGMDLHESANAILKIANTNMCNAARLISISRGYDPREFALVAFGGAGPMHAVYVAEELKIPHVVIPPWPGALSAFGCLLVDVRHDLSRTFITTAKDEVIDKIEEEFIKLENEIITRLENENIPNENMQIFREMDMRYVGQWRSLTIRCPKPIGETMEPIIKKFHYEHQREYAYSGESKEIEIYNLRVTGVGLVTKPQLPKIKNKTSIEQAKKDKREVYFERSGGFVETIVYDRNKLPTNVEFEGPAIIEQSDTTTLIPPGVVAKANEYGIIIINVK